MAATVKTTISLPKALFDQSEIVSEQLNLSPDQLFEMAVEHIIKNYLDEPISTAVPVTNEPRKINQGDIFWIRSENPDEGELGFYPHPYVVIQDNLLNNSRIHSVVVCALTSNLKQANAPGNVLLEAGEANLPKQSAVVVSKVTAVPKTQLGDYIGSLSGQRIRQILSGMRLLQSSFFNV
jgi:mRNA interferase MazF